MRVGIVASQRSQVHKKEVRQCRRRIMGEVYRIRK